MAETEDDTCGESVVDRFRSSYTLKFVASFLVVFVVIAVIGAYIAVPSSGTLSADARADLERTVRSKAATLERWATNSQDVARPVSSSGAIQSGDTDRINDTFDTLIAEAELTAGARAIHCIDASNTSILTSTLDFRVGGNPRAEEQTAAVSEIATNVDDLVLGYADTTVEIEGPDSLRIGVVPGLEWALAELVENALEHNDGDPWVRVSLDRTTTDAGQRRVVVTVSDDGPGIPEDERAAVRIDTVRTAVDHGSGFGLHVVGQVVLNAGGDVTISEAPAGGAAVTLELPIVTAD